MKFDVSAYINANSDNSANSQYQLVINFFELKTIRKYYTNTKYSISPKIGSLLEP